MKRRNVLGALAAAATGPARAQDAHTSFRTARWEELIPKGWAPMSFTGPNLGLLNDGDARVLKMMRELREAWDNAPTNPEVEGAALRLPGYVVPLESDGTTLKEFLLVPYFGACIRSPPPPANQIVHVVIASGARLRMMDAVWVSGVIRAFRADSAMGTSGYRMDAQRVEAYR